MIVNEVSDINLIKQNISDEHSFSISADAKMFTMLSDKLYADKILAPIRELSTNAFDSHFEANKLNVPFDVHMPTQDNPTFYVEDFGVGLSEDEIKNLYTIYGKSTKTKSNNVVGCLGLGSKSPFAYTDSFQIESNKNNKKTIYTAYMDSGIPKITKFYETSTNKTGLKISFSVNKSDISTFYNKAKHFFSFNDMNVNIINCTLYENKQIHKNDFGVIYEYNQYYTPIYASMGNINYNIYDYLYNLLKKHNHEDDKYKLIYNLNNCYIRLNFNIGDLDIAISRESLEQTENNENKIYNAFIKFCDQYFEQMFKLIDNNKTYFEKINVLYDNKINTSDFLKIYKNELFDFINIKIDDIIQQVNTESCSNYKNGKFNLYTLFLLYKRNEENLYFLPKRLTKSSLINFCNENNTKALFIYNKQLKDELIQYGFTIQDGSNIKIYRKPKINKNDLKYNIRLVNTNYLYGYEFKKYNYHELNEEDFNNICQNNDINYYMIINSYVENFVCSEKQMIIITGLKIKNLYLIKNKFKSKIEQYSNFKCIDDIYNKKLDNLNKNKCHIDKLMPYVYKSIYFDYTTSNIINLVKKYNLNNHKFFSYYYNISKYKNIDNSSNNNLTDTEKIYINMLKHNYHTKFENELQIKNNIFKDNYVMLYWMIRNNPHLLNSKNIHIVEYINMCDKLNEQLKEGNDDE